MSTMFAIGFVVVALVSGAFAEDKEPAINVEDGVMMLSSPNGDVVFNGTRVYCANTTRECFPSITKTIEATSSTLENLINTVNDDLVTLNGAVNELNQTLEGVVDTPNAIHSLDNRADSLSTAINGVNDDLFTTRETVATLSSILTSVTSCINCGKDKYCVAGECVACSSACGIGYGESVPCGFDHDRECMDINECDSATACFSNVMCTNTDGGYECGDCPSGFYGDGITCHPCTSCPTGFHAVVDCEQDHDVECDDVDECTTASHQCHDNSDCVNADGGYKCVCSDGFYGDGYNCRACAECPDGFEEAHACGGVFNTECIDVNECDDEPCGSNEVCVNIQGSYRCDCADLYYRKDGACIPSWGADSFLGELLNGQSLVNGGTASFKQVESSNTNVFGVAGGQIVIKQAGLVSVDYHQDTRCFSSYCTIILYAVKGDTKEIARELIAQTSNWDGIFLSSNFIVEAGTTLRVVFSSSDFRTIDNGVWARISVGFVPSEAKPSYYVGRLNNKLSGEVATFSDTYVDLNEGNEIIQSGGFFEFGKTGVVKFDYIQDIIHNCGYFYGQVIRYRASSTTVVSRELMAHTNGRWDGYHDGGSVLVNAGDKLRFNMYINRCSSESIDNGVWAPIGIGFIPFNTKQRQGTLLAYLSNKCSGSICRFTAKETTNNDVLLLSEGEVKVLKNGHVALDYHQDIIHACSYAYLAVERRRGGTSTDLVRELQAHTGGQWDGIAVSGNFIAEAGDVFRLRLECTAIQSIDNGDWGLLSAVWHPPSH
eukprot:m.19478 g.19478  ORF g.19478 m.19478 type:complete len:772 (+) comp8469_c0_seq4:64-2379(+)